MNYRSYVKLVSYSNYAHVRVCQTWLIQCVYFYLPFNSLYVRRDVLCYGVVHPSVRGHFSFPDFFFSIFVATALKLCLLLCSNEFQFQFTFRCDWFIFARVTPPKLRRILRIFQFSIIAIFSAIGLKLD
jgi:hypothetical protein